MEPSSLVLEQLSEIATATLRRKEMQFPSFSQTLPSEVTSPMLLQPFLFIPAASLQREHFEHLGDESLLLLLIFGWTPGSSRGLVKSP